VTAVFLLYPIIQAASERKTKNPTENATEDFPWWERERKMFRLQADRNP